MIIEGSTAHTAGQAVDDDEADRAGLGAGEQPD